MQLYRTALKLNCVKKPSAVQVASLPEAQTREEVSFGNKKGVTIYVRLATMSQALNPSINRSYGTMRCDSRLRFRRTLEMIVALPTTDNVPEIIMQRDMAFSCPSVNSPFGGSVAVRNGSIFD